MATFIGSMVFVVLFFVVDPAIGNICRNISNGRKWNGDPVQTHLPRRR